MEQSLVKNVRHFYSQISPDIGKTIMDLMDLPFPASLSDVKKKAEKKTVSKGRNLPHNANTY